MGDPTKLFLLEKVVEVIKRDNLLKQSKDVGAQFQKKLVALQVLNGKPSQYNGLCSE